jgi:hypothetical protein
MILVAIPDGLLLNKDDVSKILELGGDDPEVDTEEGDLLDPREDHDSSDDRPDDLTLVVFVIIVLVARAEGAVFGLFVVLCDCCRAEEEEKDRSEEGRDLLVEVVAASPDVEETVMGGTLFLLLDIVPGRRVDSCLKDGTEDGLAGFSELEGASIEADFDDRRELSCSPSDVLRRLFGGEDDTDEV